MVSLECWHRLHWQRSGFGRRTSAPHGLFGGLLCFFFGSNHWACRLNIITLRIYLAISEVISRLGSLPIYDRHPVRTIFSTRRQKWSAWGELAGNPAGKEGHCLERLPARLLQPGSLRYLLRSSVCYETSNWCARTWHVVVLSCCPVSNRK